MWTKAKNKAYKQKTSLSTFLSFPANLFKKVKGFIKKSKVKTCFNLTKATYNNDGLITWHNTSFLKDNLLNEAYEAAMKRAYRFPNIKIHWRIHVLLWAACQALKIKGDFVECGCHTGVQSTAIIHYTNFNLLKDRHFFLFDTFCGIDLSLLTEKEKNNLDKYISKNERLYGDFFEETKNYFSQFQNVTLIKGSVPESLKHAQVDQVAFLSIDMNSSAPEVGAIRYFWPKLTLGAPVVLDDYAFRGHDFQKQAIDQLGDELGFRVLSLPTGQGLIIKV